MKGLFEMLANVGSFAKGLVNDPQAGIVSLLIISDVVLGIFLVKALDANREYEDALRKCEAEKLEIARTSFDISIDQLAKLMSIQTASEKKLLQIDTAVTAVQKLKK